MMLEGVPQHGVRDGYTNASWTSKSTVAPYAARLPRFMTENGTRSHPRRPDGLMGTSPFIDRTLATLSARATLPPQGDPGTWRPAALLLDAAPVPRAVNAKELEFGPARFGPISRMSAPRGTHRREAPDRQGGGLARVLREHMDFNLAVMVAESVATPAVPTVILGETRSATLSSTRSPTG
jgi:hypothetical protein